MTTRACLTFALVAACTPELASDDVSFPATDVVVDQAPSDAKVDGYPASATYEVPVPDELASWAQFSMQRVRLRQNNDHIELDYRLPQALTGEAEHMKLKGDWEGEVIVLRGGANVAECEPTGAALRCRVAYPGLSSDPVKLETYLATVADPEERAARASVSSIFLDDPLGFIHNVHLEN